MKSITPVVSVILMVLITIVASVSAFFFINSSVSDLEAQGNLDTYPGMDNARLNLVSVTGSKVIVRNDGTNPVTDIVILINDELFNYTLNEPIFPGELIEINFTSRQSDEDLEIKIIYNKGKITQASSPASKNNENSGFTETPYSLNEISDTGIEYCFLNNVNNTWFTGLVTGNNGACCGDDENSDDFYNSTINITKNFCINGIVFEDLIDFNKTICEHYDYSWMINISYPATYSFTNDESGSIPAGFSLRSNNLNNNFLNVSDELDNHYKIVNISWQSETNGSEMWNKTTTKISSGIHTISWWIRNSVLHRNNLSFDSGAGIFISNNDFSDLLLIWHDANDGQNAVIMFNSTELTGALNILPDTWYYYSLSIDLDLDYCNLSRNGEILNNFIGMPIINYKLPNDFEIENFGFFITNGDPRDNVYIDALEVSWESSNNNFAPACCGDDGIYDNFINSTHQCVNGLFGEI
jgi:flagellin-like protein